MPSIVVGNWKMNGLRADLGTLETIARDRPSGVDVVVCVPATLLREAASIEGLRVGGEDCHAEPSGAHTGDVSAEMLADAGAGHVIVGHSERRTDHHEDDATVRAKADAALRAGLVPIVCVGETEAEREVGRTLDVLETQVRGSLPEGDAVRRRGAVLLAYEPVWAIGTGRTAEPSDVEAAHAHIAEVAGGADNAPPILYGGSVKPGNAAELLALPGVGGALVGGASLKASDFLAICAAAPR